MSPRCPGQDKRFWTEKDVYDIRCPHCGKDVEFFRDEPVLKCRSCRKEVRNPKIDLGCADWCKFATQCLGTMPGGKAVGSLCDRILHHMKEVFGDDERRINHALDVLGYAEQILRGEDAVSGLVVRAAAILHDIGIHEAERKHGSTAGRHQEIEGPPIAREILESLGLQKPMIDHVCRIIANHHSDQGIDTPEFRIVWDADRLVNIPHEFDVTDKQRISGLIEKVFKTQRGKQLAQARWLKEPEKLENQERNEE